MDTLPAQIFAAYWSKAELTANFVVFLNILGALLLGFLVGYERSYRGRAAGMRTYGLVCMASCALTVIGGYPDFWFGGHELSAAFNPAVPPDPTRVIQGIVTGVGFIGAGVIMKEGFNISGLATAASIWTVSAIGIMVGVGFYGAAMTLALLSAACMMWVSRLEQILPSRHAIALVMRFTQGFEPREDVLRRTALERGYELAPGSLSISYSNGQAEWQFVAVALGRHQGTPLPLAALAAELAKFEGVEHFNLSHARN